MLGRGSCRSGQFGGSLDNAVTMNCLQAYSLLLDTCIEVGI